MLRLDGQAAPRRARTSTDVAAKPRVHASLNTHTHREHKRPEAKQFLITDAGLAAQTQVRLLQNIQLRLHVCAPYFSTKYAMSAVGFEPTRSCLQWILSPPP